MKKVLLIESGAVGGGSAESLYFHIKALYEEYQFTVLFLRRNQFSKKIENLGVKVLYFENTLKNEKYAKKRYITNKVINLLYKLQVNFFPKYLIPFERIVNLKLITFIKDIINAEEIDLVHVNNQPNRDFYAIVAAKELNKVIISHIRTNNTYGFTSQKAQYCNQYVSTFLTYIQTKKDVWISQGIDSHKVNVLNNALEVKALEEIQVLAEYSQKKIISLIGRIRPERGYENFFKVIKQLSEKRDDFCLLIVGSYEGFESYYSKLCKIIKKLELQNYIIFYGYSDKPHNIIAESNIVVLPYTEVAFGRIVMESWQYRTPLIISDIKGIEQYIDNGENALLCQNDNILNWVESIELVLDEKEVSQKLIENGLKTYLDKYTMDIYRKNIKVIYERVK